MAACFSSVGKLALPTVHVLSQIPKLTESLKAVALPGIQIKPISFSDSFLGQDSLTEVQINDIKEVEIVVCDPNFLENAYKHMPNLKWAHCTWAGLDKFFKSVSEEPPFTITRHGTAAFSGEMAEYVVCQILNCERLSKLCWKSQQSKTWLKPERFYYFRSLNEITVSILGVGNMGSAIAQFLKARGTRILGFARNRRDQGHPLFDKISTNLDDILPECDYICNTLPDTPLTRDMLNNFVLEKCTKKPVFINVGRGSIISERELIHALRVGWLSQAVLDVFESEPLPISSELWEMEQVTITPHVSALSKAEHIAEGFVENLSSYIDGHGLLNVVNWSAGY